MRIICSANILQIIDKIPSRPSWLVWDCAVICWLRLYLALTFTPGQDPSSAALAVLAGNNGPSFSLPCPATEISQQATMITCGGSMTPLWHLRGPHYDSVVPLPPPRQSLYRPSVTIQSISVRSLPFISDNINLINFHFTEQNYRAAAALRQNTLNKQYYYHHQIVSSRAHRECCSKCVVLSHWKS